MGSPRNLGVSLPSLTKLSVGAASACPVGSAVRACVRVFPFKEGKTKRL